MLLVLWRSHLAWTYIHLQLSRASGLQTADGRTSQPPLRNHTSQFLIMNPCLSLYLCLCLSLLLLPFLWRTLTITGLELEKKRKTKDQALTPPDQVWHCAGVTCFSLSPVSLF